MLTVIRNAFVRLAAHQGFRRYFFNTSWMFGEHVLRIIAALFVGIFVARYLGPQQFGVYSYALAFVALFGAVAGLGLNSIVVRDLLNYPEKRRVYLGTAFWLKLAGALLTMVLLAGALQFTGNDDTTNLYIYIIAAGLIFQSFDVVDFYFQSQVLSKYVSIAKLIQLSLSSALKLYFIFTQADLIWFVLVSLIDQISLALALVFAFWRQKIGSFLCCFDLSTAKSMLRNSWPLILSGVAVMVYMRIDQIMIKEMLGDREVGVYSAAVRLSEAWNFVPGIITASVFSAIVNAKKISHALYSQRLQRLFTLLTWLAIGVALPMTFLADSMVSMLFGSAYQEAGSILAIHIWGAVFAFLGIASGVFFTVENYTKKSLYRTGFGAASKVLLNLALIPHYGVNGAAVATVLSQLIANCLYDIFDGTTRELFIIKLRALFPIHYVWRQG
ncbi:MAG: Membrane protein involved in the export of O-antigen and teichoic acid [Nitrospirae bacterium]|nr:MAG: Membrane protein involved in the export of O-antigen and teichoic acid [Nitrospirota bacterium]